MQEYSQEMIDYIEATFKDGKIERQEWDYLLNLAKSNSLSVDIFKKDMVSMWCYYHLHQTGEVTKKDVAKIKKLAKLMDLPEAKSDLWLTKQIEDMETKFYEPIREIRDTILDQFKRIYGYTPTGKYGRNVEDSSLTKMKRQDFINSITPSNLDEYLGCLLALKKIKNGVSGYEDYYEMVLKEARAKFPEVRMLYNKRKRRKILKKIIGIVLLGGAGILLGLMLDAGVFSGIFNDLSTFVIDRGWATEIDLASYAKKGGEFICVIVGCATLLSVIGYMVDYSDKKYEDTIVIK